MAWFCLRICGFDASHIILGRQVIVYRFGYDITTDLHHGFTLVWGKKRRKLLAFHWDWPQLQWYNRDWALDEPNCVKGLPIRRQKPKKWLLRGVNWQKSFEYRIT